LSIRIKNQHAGGLTGGWVKSRGIVSPPNVLHEKVFKAPVRLAEVIGPEIFSTAVWKIFAAAQLADVAGSSV